MAIYNEDLVITLAETLAENPDADLADVFTFNELRDLCIALGAYRTTARMTRSFARTSRGRADAIRRALGGNTWNERAQMVKDLI